MVAGIRPSFASDSANVASCVAMAMSQAGDQAHAAAERRAVHAGDRRLGQAVERGEHRRQRAGVGEVLGVSVRRHPLASS